MDIFHLDRINKMFEYIFKVILKTSFLNDPKKEDFYFCIHA